LARIIAALEHCGRDGVLPKLHTRDAVNGFLAQDKSAHLGENRRFLRTNALPEQRLASRSIPICLSSPDSLL